MARKCPRCQSNKSTTSTLWAARMYAASTELVMGPLRVIQNTFGVLVHSTLRGLKVSREIYHCSDCDLYFFECPECNEKSGLSAFPTQGSVALCMKCNKKSMLRLD